MDTNGPTPVKRTIIPDVVREQNVIALNQATTIHDTVQVMSTHNIAAVAVTDDDGKLVGIVSERDMTHRVMACGLSPLSTPLSEIMTEKPEFLRPGDTCIDAVELMLGRGFRHLPVLTDSGKIVAMVSIRDLLQAAMEELNAHLESARAQAFAPEQ